MRRGIGERLLQHPSDKKGEYLPPFPSSSFIKNEIVRKIDDFIFRKLLRDSLSYPSQRKLRKILMALLILYFLFALLAFGYLYLTKTLGFVIPPFSVRQFRIVRVLGEGQAGTVYKAEVIPPSTSSSSSSTNDDEPLTKPKFVAIKKLDGDRGGNWVTAEQELRIGRMLFSEKDEEKEKEKEANQVPLVRLLDGFVEIDQKSGKIQRWLVFEYLAGGTLKDSLKSIRTDLEDVKGIMRQLLKALEFLTRKRIVSRDVKPSNVFLEKRKGDKYEEGMDISSSQPASACGGEIKVKWGDFGDAIALDAIRSEKHVSWWWDTHKETPSTLFLRPESIISEQLLEPQERTEQQLRRDRERSIGKASRERTGSSSSFLWGGEGWIWSHDIYGIGSILLSFPLDWSGAKDLDTISRKEDGVGTLIDRIDNSEEVQKTLIQFGGHHFLDLLRRLLAKDPQLRISPVEALFHPFLFYPTPSTDSPPSSSTFDTGALAPSSVNLALLFSTISKRVRTGFKRTADGCVCKTRPLLQPSSNSISLEGECNPTSDVPTLDTCFPKPPMITPNETTRSNNAIASATGLRCRKWLREATECLEKEICKRNQVGYCEYLVLSETGIIRGTEHELGYWKGEDAGGLTEDLLVYCQYFVSYICDTFGVRTNETEQQKKWGFDMKYGCLDV
jgi:serine/threonine protein kinase